MKIFRTYIFHSARYLPKLDDKHPCSKMHGHTFNMVIEIDGPIDKKNGFVMDFYDIDMIVKDNIIKFIDHKILNDIDDLPNPTSEFLTIWIWNRLKPHLPLLSCITVSEEHGTGMTYKGN